MAERQGEREGTLTAKVSIDLHMGNVMLTFPDSEFANLSPNQPCGYYGWPVGLPIDVYAKDIVNCADCADKPAVPTNPPPYVVKKLMSGGACDKLGLGEARVKIKGFRRSWHAEAETRRDLETPDSCRAPEAMVAAKLGMLINYPADVWALGCLLFEIYAATDVFGSCPGDHNDVWADLVGLMGPPPRPWLEAWDKRSEYVDDDGKLLDRRRPALATIE